jgi:alpha-glucosidase
MQHHRCYEIRLPGDWPPASVTVNGINLAHSAKTGWSYEGNTLTTVIRTAAFPVTENVTITVRRDPDLISRNGELDGFAGIMTRLHQTYDVLNQNWPLGWSPDGLIEALQTGDRLSYHPEDAGKELSRFHHQLLPRAVEQAGELAKGLSDDQKKELVERGTGFASVQRPEKKLEDYNARVSRAHTILESLDISK